MWDELDKWLEVGWRKNWNPALQEHIRQMQEFVRAERQRSKLPDELVERDAEIERLREACQAALRALDTYAAMYRHHMTLQLISARAGLRKVLGGGIDVC